MAISLTVVAVVVIPVVAVTVMAVVAMMAVVAVASLTVMSAPVGPECHFIGFDSRVTGAGKECQHESE